MMVNFGMVHVCCSGVHSSFMMDADDCMVHVCCSGVHSSFMMDADDCMVCVCCSGVHGSCVLFRSPQQLYGGCR